MNASITSLTPPPLLVNLERTPPESPPKTVKPEVKLQKLCRGFLARRLVKKLKHLIYHELPRLQYPFILDAQIEGTLQVGCIIWVRAWISFESTLQVSGWVNNKLRIGSEGGG